MGQAIPFAHNAEEMSQNFTYVSETCAFDALHAKATDVVEPT
jgi:hypothetical protein